MEAWSEVCLSGVKSYTRLRGEPAPRACLDELADYAGGWLPADYLDVMSRSNGFEGVVGSCPDVGWPFRLLPCEEALTATRAYRVREYEPDLFLLGTDGSGTAYLIDTRSHEWVELPFLDFGAVGHSRLERRFDSLRGLLENLASG